MTGLVRTARVRRPAVLIGPDRLLRSAIPVSVVYVREPCYTRTDLDGRTHVEHRWRRVGENSLYETERQAAAMLRRWYPRRLRSGPR